MLNSKNIKLIIFNWLPVFVWAGVIFYLSSIPSLKSDFEADFLLRKLAHIFEYFVLLLLVARAFLNTRLIRDKYSFKLIMVGAILISFLYAISDEYHQTFVFGRNGSLKDVGIDSIGIFLGVLSFYIWKKLFKKV